MTDTAHRWVRLTACENIPLREGKAIDIAGRQLAVFNLGDSFRAVENRCPHRGGPLADGILSGSAVVCPLHAWTFDLTDGRVRNDPQRPACLATFPVRIEEGMVSVQLPIDRHDPQSAPASCHPPDRPVRWVQRKTIQSSTLFASGSESGESGICPD